VSEGKRGEGRVKRSQGKKRGGKSVRWRGVSWEEGRRGMR